MNWKTWLYKKMHLKTNLVPLIFGARSGQAPEMCLEPPMYTNPRQKRYLKTNWLDIGAHCRLCVMPILHKESQSQPTRDIMLKRYSAIQMLLPRNHGIARANAAKLNSSMIDSLEWTYDLLKFIGTVSNRSTPCCKRMLTGPLVGL